MKLVNVVYVFVAVLAFATLAAAQAPVQTGGAKVGVINSELFSDAKTGVTKLTTALRTLESEFAPRRDEITRLVARFDELQKVLPGATRDQLAARQDQAATLQIDIRRKQEDARTAYARRLTALTGPIRLSIFNALQAYAKQRGLDLLIDVAKFPDGVFLMNQGADLTPAFIKEYNTRNP